MPDGPRKFFGYIVNGDGTVIGGYKKKKDFKSAWTYNVAPDKWNHLPEQNRSTSAKAYSIMTSSMLSNILQSLTHFDMSIRQWSEKNIMFSRNICKPKTCVEGSDRKVYAHLANDVVVLEDDTC